MQILSYPVGLLIGLFPIAVDLGPTPSPAHLILDSRPVCVVTERSPGCMVDLGPDPRVHLLELVRTDSVGHVTERAQRWINRPGIEPELIVNGGCDEKKHECAFEVIWAHPGKLDPERVDLTLDGAKVWHGRDHHVKVALRNEARPQVVVADAEFPDGSRATYTRTLYSFYPEEASAALQAVAIVPEASAATAEGATTALKSAGLRVRTVEETEPEVTFVMAPQGFDSIDGVVPKIPGMPGRYTLAYGSPVSNGAAVGEHLHLLLPDETLSGYDMKSADQLGRLHQPFAPSHLSRYADAVAAAGYALGGTPRRRAVVLILSGFEHPNVSSFSAAQARAYLAEVMVPLVVWRVGGVLAPEWPDGPRLSSARDVEAAFKALRAELNRQRIAWLEGARDLRHAGRWLAPGVAVAGRDAAPGAAASARPAAAQSRLTSSGPDGGPVYALAVASDRSLVYAATHSGVFRSRDLGVHWESASLGLPLTPVRCLAIASGNANTLYAGTEVGLYRSTDAGAHWLTGDATLKRLRIASLALDASNPRVLYAGTEGQGVLRSDDSAVTVLASTLDHGDVRALVVDPRDHSVLAASDAGVFRSVDRGQTWTPAAGPPGRVLSLATDPGRPGRILAGTAGNGIFVSDDGAATWSPTAVGAAFITDIRVDPETPSRVLAGSPDGILSSVDGGATWKLARVDPVASLAMVTRTAALAGGVRGILRRADPAHGWTDSNAGLSAQIVYSAAFGPGSPAPLYAGTSTGLRAATSTQSEWAAVPGLSEGAPAYSVAFGGGTARELLVGTPGQIGRSTDAGASWAWVPTHAAFALTTNLTHDSSMFGATRAGVLKSVDGGSSWTSASAGMEKTFAFRLAGDPRDPSVLYAATAGAGVFRSANGARDWKPTGSELARSIVRSVAVDAGAGRVLYAGTDSGVFTSTDGGADWAWRSEGLPDATVYALLTDARLAGTIFAGTSAGLFRTTDGGTSWSAFPATGVPAGVTTLALDPSGKELVAGTLGAGVFRVPLGE